MENWKFHGFTILNPWSYEFVSMESGICFHGQKKSVQELPERSLKLLNI